MKKPFSSPEIIIILMAKDVVSTSDITRKDIYDLSSLNDDMEVFGEWSAD